MRARSHGPSTVASAPGKVNAFLASGTVQPDGYHPLTTVFQAVSLREYVQIGPRREGGLKVETLAYRPTDPPTFDEELTRQLAPLDEDNIACAAGEALFREAGVPTPSAQITVHKTIPVAGGMAGGSADAAATLVALNAAYALNFPLERLEQVGRRVGADVPACLVGGLSLGLGRGDLMRLLKPGTEAPTPRSWWWVACVFNRGLSTAEVFKQFDRDRPPIAPRTSAGEDLDPKVEAAFTSDTPAALLPLRNDLQRAAFQLHPDLHAVEKRLSEAGCTATLMSGAGPTMLGLVGSEDEAKRVVSDVAGLAGLKGAYPIWGPTVGARVETGLPNWAKN